MKVIKVDIKQEVLDLEPRPHYYFRKPKGFPAVCIGEEDMPNGMVKKDIEEYKVFEFHNSYTKSSRINYLIKVNDKGLVDSLVKIEEDVLRQKILENNLQVNEQGWRDCKKYIKKLHFWERLFNKF